MQAADPRLRALRLISSSDSPGDSSGASVASLPGGSGMRSGDSRNLGGDSSDSSVGGLLSWNDRGVDHLHVIDSPAVSSGSSGRSDAPRSSVGSISPDIRRFGILESGSSSGRGSDGPSAGRAASSQASPPAFDTASLNGSEVRAIVHAWPLRLSPMASCTTPEAQPTRGPASALPHRWDLSHRWPTRSLCPPVSSTEAVPTRGLWPLRPRPMASCTTPEAQPTRGPASALPHRWGLSHRWPTRSLCPPVSSTEAVPTRGLSYARPPPLGPQPNMAFAPPTRGFMPSCTLTVRKM